MKDFMLYDTKNRYPLEFISSLRYELTSLHKQLMFFTQISHLKPDIYVFDNSITLTDNDIAKK